MALTYSPAPAIGWPCPGFSLTDVVSRDVYTIKNFYEAPVLVVMFICNHCPYVKAIEDRILDLAREMGPKGAAFVAICSNDAKRYSEDSAEKLRARALEKNYPFAYLHDESQAVAKRFDAVATPDFFVFDKDRKLAYRGRLDDNWKEADKVTRHEMKEAIELILKGATPPEKQHPSMGCSIKWVD